MAKFLKNIQYDLRLFLYTWGLIMIFRCAFIGIYHNQLNTATVVDIGEALFLGARLSLKVSGFVMALSFLFITIPQCVIKRWSGITGRLVIGCISSSILALLFMIRIPYYQVFQQGFNIMIFNGLTDDKKAIFSTMLNQYQLLPRILGIVVLSIIVMYGWYHILRLKPNIPTTYLRIKTLIIIVLIPIIAVFLRFGGAFNLADGVGWENAARTKNNLLNEAILDDGQALYRAYSAYKRTHQQVVRSISESELHQAIQILGGNPTAKTLDDAFLHKAQGSPLQQQPTQVVFILGENYALWPLLPQYRNLGLVQTGEKMERDGAHTYHFLANGNGTMTSLNGLLTGIPDVGIYTNFTMGEHGDVSQFGIASVMKKMGYKTVFWYGGPRSWQNIGDFTRKEGFDEFHGIEEFPSSSETTSWGVPDEVLFQAVENYIKQDTGKTFHFILTTSNHPPFSIDVDSRGFKRGEVMAKLPSSISKDAKTVTQLGHIWYADNMMGQFITDVQKDNPSTLFVVTGDHAERFDFATDVSLTERSLIPVFFYGDGITKEMIPDTSVGTHIQIMPTLAELLLPEGVAYESLLPPLQHSSSSFNHRLVIENGKVEEQNKLKNDPYMDYVEAARTVAIWRISKGNDIY